MRYCVVVINDDGFPVSSCGFDDREEAYAWAAKESSLQYRAAVWNVDSFVYIARYEHGKPIPLF